MKLVDSTESVEGTFELVLEWRDKNPSYAYGFEAGTVYQRLIDNGVLGSEEHPITLLEGNIKIYEDMQASTGTVFHCKPSEIEGWIWAWFTKRAFKPVIV